MSKLKSFSQEVVKEAGLDPVTIITVIYMVISIAKAIYDCHNTHYRNLIIRARTPGPFEKIWMQKKIRRHLKGEAYNKYGKRIIDAIFQKTGELTEAELRDILDEVQKGDK